MAQIIITSKDQFDKEVLHSDIPVIIDFWAEWCGPCKMVEPVFEELSNEYNGKAKFMKVNIDDLVDIGSQYGIQSIPTMLFFKNGELISRMVGAHSKNSYIQELNKL